MNSVEVAQYDHLGTLNDNNKQLSQSYNLLAGSYLGLGQSRSV